MRVSDLVEQILIDIPQTRSDDRYLLLKVWERCGLILDPVQQTKFMDVPSSETIRRIRQKIQESGRYPADETIRKHRKFKSMQVQQRITQTRPDQVDNLINQPIQGRIF